MSTVAEMASIALRGDTAVGTTALTVVNTRVNGVPIYLKIVKATLCSLLWNKTAILYLISKIRSKTLYENLTHA